MRMRQLAICITCLVAAVPSAQATTLGPTYPAPGGNDWQNTGTNPTEGTAIWEFTNFDVTGLDALYYAFNNIDYGHNGAGLDNTLTDFAFQSVAGDTATWNAATQYWNGSQYINANVQLVATISFGSASWETDLASIGLDDTVVYGEIGAVIDNSAGDDFHLSWKVEGDVGSGWQQLNGPPNSGAIQQFSGYGGHTRSSVAWGFYYVESEVPAPTGVIGLASLGVIGLGVVARRRRKS